MLRNALFATFVMLTGCTSAVNSYNNLHVSYLGPNMEQKEVTTVISSTISEAKVRMAFVTKDGEITMDNPPLYAWYVETTNDGNQEVGQFSVTGAGTENQFHIEMVRDYCRETRVINLMDRTPFEMCDATVTVQLFVSD